MALMTSIRFSSTLLTSRWSFVLDHVNRYAIYDSPYEHARVPGSWQILGHGSDLLGDSKSSL
jgi:hypothetical protein